jgi:hypothetical protein
LKKVRTVVRLLQQLLLPVLFLLQTSDLVLFREAAGLGAPSYNSLIQGAIGTATSGEKVFCGPSDDPFFVDLAGAFDLGNFRPQGNSTNATKDGVARFNVHSIVLQIPISMLQKDGKDVSMAANILDSDFVIGVWATASRQEIKTLSIPVVLTGLFR